MLTNQEEDLFLQMSQVAELTRSKAWQEVLKPKLEQYLKHSWVDPRQCKDLTEFGWKDLQASMAAQVVREILEFIEGAEKIAKQLQDKKEGKVENKFAIGK